MLNRTHLPLGLLVSSCLSLQAVAQEGKDGAETITTGSVIFNRYSNIAANVPAGSSFIKIADRAQLSASAIAGAQNNPYATDTLGYGDLIMVIKMQGAEISASNDASFGEIINYRNTGRYELRVVRYVRNDTIYLCGNLVFDYTVGGNQRGQVVRIPRLSSITVTPAGVLTGTPWNGITGGVVAVESTSNVWVDGQINATAIGFRGGELEGNSSNYGIISFLSADGEDGGEKGESIAGGSSDYDVLGGRYGRGAPANGGGGGNAHNAAGGGGANAGATALWTGQGNPMAGHDQAWNLEAPGFANHTSTGGGRGGYSYSASDEDATLIGPGHFVWDGDDRRNMGGFGGRPLAYDINTLFMGGGGGAADANNDCGGEGANGGGIIYILAHGDVSGSGQISAAGGMGGNTSYINIDAAGGGGGGGAIRLNVGGTISGVNINADGGKGGDQIWVHTPGEAEGPGGGGGGGYIITTGVPTASISVAGGLNGVTFSDALTEFVPNGATAGGTGVRVNNIGFAAAPPLFCSVLPVRLTMFTANKVRTSTAKITWSVTDEQTVISYSLEQQMANGSWKRLAELPAKRLAAATYILEQELQTGANHFRLRIESNAQSVTYSAIRTVVNEVAGKGIRILATSNVLRVVNLPRSVTSYQVIGSNGSLMKQGQVSGQNELVVATEQFSAGVYYLRINTNNGSDQKAFLIQ